MGQRPFQRFLDEHREAVYRLLVATAGHDDADDCFQETFIAALRAYPKLRPDSNEKAWILTIAHRKALDHFNARKRRPLPVEELPEVPHHDTDSLADDGTWSRVRELPPKQRAAVTLRYAADLTHAEVAQALGCTEEAARRSAHEGLKKLREELAA